MNEDDSLSPLGAEMVAGLSAFCDALESGTPVEERFTVRTVTLDLKPRPYEAADVKHTRAMLNASQPLFAMLLGVSVKTIRSWEQGARRVPPMACRFMDEINSDPEHWKDRLRQSVVTE